MNSRRSKPDRKSSHSRGEPAATAASSRRGPSRIVLAAMLFLAAAFISFGPAIVAPFDFDDNPAIRDNASIRTFWPPSALWNTPPLGIAVSGRPVANYSFAFNYAVNRWLSVSQAPSEVSPHETVSYHCVNIVLHVLVALFVFALLRDTIRFGRVPEDWRASADRLAGLVAGLWLIHPIQTEAVDYISQRTEVLASLWYMATLYAALRAWQEHRTIADDPSAGRRVTGWSAAAIVACLLGMATKEIAITAPLAVVLFDRAFLFSSWREAWGVRWRRRLYYSLFATSALSIGLIAHGARDQTVGFTLGIPWYQYLYSQAWAIPHYLRLTLWPDQLTHDYGRSPISDLSGVAGSVGLVVFIVATLCAWTRPRWLWFAFVGSFFLLLLAPSSSFVPIQTEIAGERRIYLALVSVIILFVVGAEHIRRRVSGPSADKSGRRAHALATFLLVAVGATYFAICTWTAEHFAPSDLSMQLAVRCFVAVASVAVVWCTIITHRGRLRSAAVAALAVVMMGASFNRSALYVDVESLWRDAAAKRPDNARAYDGLATAELRKDSTRFAEADSLLSRALTLDSTFVAAYRHRAAIAIKQARLTDADSLLRHALRLSPGDSGATERLGRVLVAEGRPDLALPYVKQMAQVLPGSGSFASLGIAYLTAGDVDSAIVALTRAVHFDSTNTEALGFLGGALIEEGRGAEALPYLLLLVRYDPGSGFALGQLSVAYAQAHEPDMAARMAAAAVARSPRDAAAYVFAGRGLQIAGRYQEATQYLAEAVRLSPDDPQALTRLGISEASLGRKSEAAIVLRRALALSPNYQRARRALESLGLGALR